jgi:hypothetical protein
VVIKPIGNAANLVECLSLVEFTIAKACATRTLLPLMMLNARSILRTSPLVHVVPLLFNPVPV